MAIVSHKNRFIFIKTRKTAGSSAEIALSRVCDDVDFITPIGAENSPDEQLRCQEGGHGPVNWRKPWWRYRTIKEIRHRLKRGHRAPVLGTHATAEQLRAYFGEDIWANYFRFTIERNPWDKAVSRYWWMKYRRERKGRTDFPTVGDFLRRVARERPHWLTSWDHYTVDDRIAVDQVLFYENLSAGMTALEQRMNLAPGALSLPRQRAKGGLRKDARPYQEILSTADRELIAHVCRREIAAFGYEFDRECTNRLDAES